jgi:hypothetical protein
VPEQPGFGREKFIHSIKELVPGVAYDDKYELNTQSGSQWDGFRHVRRFPNTFPSHDVLTWRLAVCAYWNTAVL